MIFFYWDNEQQKRIDYGSVESERLETSEGRCYRVGRSRKNGPPKCPLWML